MAYILSADSLSSLGATEVSIKYDDTPISVYRIVHATGNKHAGGANDGLLSVEKFSMLLPVRSADRPPTSRGIRIHMMSNFLLIRIGF